MLCQECLKYKADFSVIEAKRPVRISEILIVEEIEFFCCSICMIKHVSEFSDYIIQITRINVCTNCKEKNRIIAEADGLDLKACSECRFYGKSKQKY